MAKPDSKRVTLKRLELVLDDDVERPRRGSNMTLSVGLEPL